MTVIHDAAPPIPRPDRDHPPYTNCLSPLYNTSPFQSKYALFQTLIHLVSPIPSRFLLHARRAGP